MMLGGQIKMGGEQLQMLHSAAARWRAAAATRGVHGVDMSRVQSPGRHGQITE